MKRNLGLKQDLPAWLVSLILLVLTSTCVVVLLITLRVWHDIKTDNVPKNSHPDLSLPHDKISALNERGVAAMDWLADFRDIVVKTNDTEARELLEVAKHSVVAIPTETGVLIIGKKTDDTAPRIIPLLPSDKQYTLWKGFFTETAMADFVSLYGASIVLRNDAPISPLFRGIIFAHETRHLRFFQEHPYEIRSNRAYCEEERDTHEFENRLLLKIGGEPYKQLLLKEINHLSAKQSAEGVSFPLKAAYNYELDKIFGPALSDSERATREAALLIDTVFRFIDAHFNGDKKEPKTEFLCQIYISQGILQKE